MLYPEGMFQEPDFAIWGRLVSNMDRRVGLRGSSLFGSADGETWERAGVGLRLAAAKNQSKRGFQGFT